MTTDTRDALLATFDAYFAEGNRGLTITKEEYAILRTPRPESDARDAARYRWLRDNAWNACGQVVCWFEHDDGGLGESVTFKGEHFDAAIDAAITQPEATR